MSKHTTAIPELIAIDLDGTLLEPDGQLSERSTDAIRAASDAGIRVVLATGRPPHLVADLADRLAGAVSHVVATNGSIISTFPAEPDGEPQLLHLLSFDIDHARQIVRAVRNHDPAHGFAFATDAGFAHEDGFAQRMPAAVHDPASDDVLSLGGTVAFKLFAFHPRIGALDLLDTLPPIIAGVGAHDAFAVGHMGADAVEIGPASIDKAAGLAWLCDHLDVDQRRVMAIGDERNDLTMVQWAGHGVAMANADDEVRAAADEIAPSNAESGVAVILERLVEHATGGR